MFKYDFDVPDNKKYRIIVHTDCKNEVDDQFALAHHTCFNAFVSAYSIIMQRRSVKEDFESTKHAISVISINR